MSQYLVCNYLPDDFDPSTVTEAMMEDIHALNLVDEYRFVVGPSLQEQGDGCWKGSAYQRNCN